MPTKHSHASIRTLIRQLNTIYKAYSCLNENLDPTIQHCFQNTLMPQCKTHLTLQRRLQNPLMPQSTTHLTLQRRLQNTLMPQ
jgi:hypothetical protein